MSVLIELAGRPAELLPQQTVGVAIELASPLVREAQGGPDDRVGRAGLANRDDGLEPLGRAEGGPLDPLQPVGPIERLSMVVDAWVGDVVAGRYREQPAAAGSSETDMSMAAAMDVVEQTERAMAGRPDPAGGNDGCRPTIET
jgi:hypothetical protein